MYGVDPNMITKTVTTALKQKATAQQMASMTLAIMSATATMSANSVAQHINKNMEMGNMDNPAMGLPGSRSGSSSSGMSGGMGSGSNSGSGGSGGAGGSGGGAGGAGGR